MADKTVAEKLHLKPGMTAAIVNPPDAFDLGIPENVLVTDDPGRAEFVLEFASSQAEAEEQIRGLSSAINEKTVTWVAYPKGSKAKGFDISRDTIGRFAPCVGLIVNANFSIDETWSAVRMRPMKPGERSPFA